MQQRHVLRQVQTILLVTRQSARLTDSFMKQTYCKGEVYYEKKQNQKLFSENHDE